MAQVVGARTDDLPLHDDLRPPSRSAEISAEGVRVFDLDPSGDRVGEWTRRPIPLPDRWSRPPTLLDVHPTEWNTELLVHTPDGLLLWRVSPNRGRLQQRLMFAPHVPMWGVHDVQNTPTGFTLRARNGLVHELNIDPATGKADLRCCIRTPQPRRAGPTPIEYVQQPAYASLHAVNYDVFVSYKDAEARSDAEAAVTHLRSRQASVFFDKEVPLTGDFKDKIVQGIRESFSFLVIHSASTDSPPEVDDDLDEVLQDGQVVTTLNQSVELRFIDDWLRKKGRSGEGLFKTIYSLVPGEPTYDRNAKWQIHSADTPIEKVVDLMVRELNSQRGVDPR